GEGFFEAIATRWRLRGTPRTRVADLREGTIAKVVGTLRPIDEPLMAPFTGRSCVGFRVAGYRHEASRREGPILLDDVEEGHRFYLDDETGTVRIDRKGYCKLYVPTLRITHGGEHGAARHIERYFARYGQERRTFFESFSPASGIDLWAPARFTYHEQALLLGARVAVLGVVRSTGEPAPETGRAAGYRDRQILMAIEPPDDARLVVSDRPAHLR
ncbi:MAG: hypothetical protein K8H88_20230, partial [Sandaracinaceae bacterium]|nr:hypothetical protein [Sandaracinaceae bacterium]